MLPFCTKRRTFLSSARAAPVAATKAPAVSTPNVRLLIVGIIEAPLHHPPIEEGGCQARPRRWARRLRPRARDLRRYFLVMFQKTGTGEVIMPSILVRMTAGWYH